MTKTKTVIIIGCFMLALAVLAALELRSGKSVLDGQSVTGTLSKEEPPIQNDTDSPKTTNIPSLADPKSKENLPKSNDIASNKNKPANEAALPAQSPPPKDPAVTDLEEKAAHPVEIPAKNENETALESAAQTPPVDPPAPPKPPVTEAEAAPSKTQPLPITPAPGDVAKPALAEADPAPAKAEPVPTKTEPAPAKTEPAPAVEASVKTKPAKTAKDSIIIITRSPQTLAEGAQAIIWGHLEVSSKEVLFRFTGAAPLQGSGFHLADPPRFVVDLKGLWGLRLPRIPKNNILKDMRIGRHGDNSRIVFDLGRSLPNSVVRQANKETLEVYLR